MNVAVLGASSNPQRYAYKAAKRLLEKGHRPIGVNPQKPVIEGVEVVARLGDLPTDVHTLTMYVGKDRSTTLANEILEQGFKRVIFNPGSENPELMERLRKAGASVVEGCTLVMLSTGTF
ncbi:MAG: CoA-binding protein [Polyangiaceae bacterium]